MSITGKARPTLEDCPKESHGWEPGLVITRVLVRAKCSVRWPTGYVAGRGEDGGPQDGCYLLLLGPTISAEDKENSVSLTSRVCSSLHK